MTRIYTVPYPVLNNYMQILGRRKLLGFDSQPLDFQTGPRATRHNTKKRRRSVKDHPFLKVLLVKLDQRELDETLSDMYF